MEWRRWRRWWLWRLKKGAGMRSGAPPREPLLEEHEQHDREQQQGVHIVGELHVEDGDAVDGDRPEEDEGGRPRRARDEDLLQCEARPRAWQQARRECSAGLLVGAAGRRASLPKGEMARPSEAASCRMAKMNGTKRIP